MREKIHLIVIFVVLLFSEKGHLKEHSTSVHEGKNQFKCDICTFTFTKKWYLLANSVSSHEGKKPFWKDDICSSSWTRKSNLKAVHGGKKPFECDACSDTFFSKISIGGVFSLSSLEKEAIRIDGTNRNERLL